MRKIQLLAGILISFVLCLHAESQAQDTKFVKLPAKGKTLTISLGDADKSLKSVVFYAQSPGVSTEHMQAYLASGNSITATASYKTLPAKKSLDLAAQDSAGWSPFVLNVGGKNTKVIKIDPSSDNSSGGGSDTGTKDPYCYCLTDKEIQSYLDMFRPNYPDLTRQQLCDYLMYGQQAPMDCSSTGGGGTSGGGNTQLTEAFAFGIIQKNSCENYKYLAQIKVDLSKISADDFAKGITVVASLTFTEYGGDKAALIKPDSDGKYHGQPIVLMAAMGYGAYGAEVIRVVRWKGTKIISQATLTNLDTAFARGHFFWRKPIGSVLHGGRGVFELVNNSEKLAYSHCFTLSRTRQARGGYK